MKIMGIEASGGDYFRMHNMLCHWVSPNKSMRLGYMGIESSGDDHYRMLFICYYLVLLDKLIQSEQT